MVCSNGATIHCVHYLNVSFEVRHSIKRRQSDCLVCIRYHGSLVIRFRYYERMTRKWYAKRIRIVVGLKSSFCVHHLSHNRREWENNKGFELKSFAMWVVVVPTHGSHLHWTCAQWRVNICEHTTNELQQIYIYIYSIENGRELNWRGEWLNASVHSKYIAHAYEYPSLSHFCIVICRNFIFFYSFPFCITHRATMSVPRTASLRKYIDNIDGNIKNIHWSIKTSPSYF